MRIPIHRATQSLENGIVPHAPAPLARLSPSGELVLVEMQGTLEMEGVDPRGGETIGTISFPKNNESKPVLQISHHRLEGSIVKLRKPLAVLEKRVRKRGEEQEVCPASLASQALDEPILSSPPASPPGSPTLSRKRAHQALETPPRTQRVPPSSSPMPERPPSLLDGHADFSSPSAGAKNAQVLPTSTSYSVVTLIRHKILFSSRPEPIVRLET